MRSEPGDSPDARVHSALLAVSVPEVLAAATATLLACDRLSATEFAVGQGFHKVCDVSTALIAGISRRAAEQASSRCLTMHYPYFRLAYIHPFA